MILQGRTNAFNGFEVDPERLPDRPEDFRAALEKSLVDWRREGLSMVWLKVPIAQSFAIAIAVDHGFVFHHSQIDYTMLTCELEAGTFIPPYATHYIGAGGVVLDEENNLLVVNERYRANRAQPFWKLPGGLLDPGEHLVDGIRREIREETGIETEFLHLVALWHWHGYQFGKSGIYMVCRLKPLSSAITRDETEIDECVWMPLAEYQASPYVSDFNQAIVEAGVRTSTLAVTDLKGYPRPESHEFFFPRHLPRGMDGAS